MPVPIYLIRHAQVTPEPDQPAAGWSLSAQGLQQAQAIADLPFWPEVKTIYCSPERKALDTISPTAQRYGLPVLIAEDLRELERPLGLIEDYQAAVAQAFASPDQSSHGFEPAAQARDRFGQAVRQLADGAGDSPIAVVAHGLVFALFLAALDGRTAPSIPEWRSIPMPGWALLDLDKATLLKPFQPVV